MGKAVLTLRFGDLGRGEGLPGDQGRGRQDQKRPSILLQERPRRAPLYVRRLTVATESVADRKIIACNGCGGLAVDHGRRTHRLADAPILGTPTELV